MKYYNLPDDMKEKFDDIETYLGQPNELSGPLSENEENKFNKCEDDSLCGRLDSACLDFLYNIEE